MTTDPGYEADDDHGPHLNTAEDPYLARRAVDAETERTRQLDALERMDGLIVYLERGAPVTLLTRHRLPSKANPPALCPPWLRWNVPPRGAPRNVLVRRESGELVIRPFRGLRRPR